jgi:hypothetical protein
MHRIRRKLAYATATVFVALMGVAGAGQATGKESPPRPPKVWTKGAYFIHGTYAVLQGWLAPRGQIATFYFEWGQTKAYGTILELAIEQEFGGYRTEEADEAIPGLRPHTKYHFRIVAHSPGGTSYGKDKTFRTRGRGTD